MAAIGAAISLTLSLTVSGTARADYFHELYADDANHDFYVGSGLTTAERDGFRQAMAMLDSTTDMYDTERTNLPAGTDINFYAVTDRTGEEAGWYAWTTCNTKASSSVCDRWHILFNHANPHPDYKSLACHEIGHSIGLDHQPGNNSSYATGARTCMRGQPDHRDYSEHDKGHINARY